MVIEIEDYYALLGVERDATLETIKLAYRRLARASHPDMVSHEGQGAEVLASHRMAGLNEAYGVLSRTPDRADYDRRLLGDAEPRPEVCAASRPRAGRPGRDVGMPVEPRSRPRAGGVVVENLVSAFLGRVRNGLVGSGSSGAFKEVDLEGFDWAVRSKSFSSCDWIVVRGFQDLTLNHVRRYHRSVDEARSEAKGILRRNRMLFVLAHYQVEDPAAVLDACRRMGVALKRDEENATDAFLVLADVETARLRPMAKVEKGSWVTDQIDAFRLSGGRSRKRV